MTSPKENGCDVLLFFSDAGGGHRRAVEAVLAAAEETHAPLRLRALSLSEVLRELDLLWRLTGHSVEDAYNALLRNGHTNWLDPLLRVLHGTERLLRRPVVRRLSALLASERPAVVLSVHPNFNAALRDAVRAALPGAPFVVLMTDYADFPPHFWIEPGIDRVIVGSDHAREQALTLGIPPEHVTRASGMVLHPRFYGRGGPAARAQARAALGIAEGTELVLMLFGGKGAAQMEPLARALLSTDPSWHVLAICGDNPELLQRLAALDSVAAGRLHRLGFTDRIADYMAAADVLLTKPGPGSLAEAFHERLAVVVTSNRGTIPQERWNAEMVAREELGLVVRDWQEMPAAALRLLREPGLRARVRANLAALRPNRAVHEALEVLTAELKRSRG